MRTINLERKFAAFSEHWRPKLVAELNGQGVKLVKIQGEFPWHSHADADELFLCLKGRFRMELRDGVHPVEAGEMFLVPKGVEHRPVADEEAEILLFEPAGVANTGEVRDERFTAPDGVRI